MSQTAKYQIIIFFLSFAIILMGSFGYYRYSSTLGFEKNQSEVLTLIKDNYLREFPDAKKLDEYKIKGEVAALEDPYTQYFTTKEEQKLEADLNQKFFGIGVKLEKVGESFKVVQVLKSGGAESAGVTVGDIVVKVNDQLADYPNVEMLADKIRGEQGTKVKIDFLRGAEVKTFEIERRPIQAELATLDIQNDTAIIAITTFGETVDANLATIAAQIKANPSVKKIILDMRSNTGGLLDQAIATTSYFLPAGYTVVKQKSKNPKGGFAITEEKTIAKANSLSEYSLSILTDGFSASASEIVAGALRDQRSVQLIGQKTFGKGVVQKIFPLSNGDAVKITVAEWLTPKDHSIDKNGLEPDVKVKVGEDILKVALGK